MAACTAYREGDEGLARSSPRSSATNSSINVCWGQAWGPKVGGPEPKASCPAVGTDPWTILGAVRWEGYDHTGLTDGGTLMVMGLHQAKGAAQERGE